MEKFNIEIDVKCVIEQDMKMSGIDKTQLRYNVTIHKPQKRDKCHTGEYVMLSILNNMVSDMLPVKKVDFEPKDYGLSTAKELASDIVKIMQKLYPDGIYYSE
jgi:hypothetical protein